MAVNVKLAEFDVDLDAVTKSAAQLKKAIDELKDAQRENKKAGDTSSETYIENEAALRTLNTEYRKHIKVLSDNIQATADQAAREDLLNAALNTEAVTIEDLRAQNKLLNQLRNQTNIYTEEGRKQLEALNKQLNDNNDLIKENVDELSQQRLNVGNYEDSIKSALQEMNPFNQSIGEFAGRVQEAGGASAFFTQQLAGLQKGIVGVTRASIAFIATPIGAILAAIAIAVALVSNAMNRSEEATNKMNKVFSVFSGSVNFVLKALEPLGEFLIDGIVKGFELATQSVLSFVELAAGALEALGFDDAADGVREYAGAYAQAIKEAQDLAEAEANLEKAQRQARLTQLEYQKQAEEFRQIRDDESLSIRERIQANERLGDVLDAQLQKELELARAALEVANLRIEQEGETKEALDAQYEALTEIADIEERITSQRSEQLQNRMALQREASDAALQQQQDALDLFIAEQGIRARTLQEELALEEAVSEKRKEILKAELEAKKISQDAYAAELINIDNELAQRRAEIASDNAMREVEANRMLLEQQRENAQFLSEELAEQRKNENAEILRQEQELAALRLEQGLINQQEFDDRIRELSEANRIANKEIDDQRKEVERQEALELRAIEFEAELARMMEEGATAFELQQAQLAEQRQLELQQLELDREQGAISEELYNARLNQINARYDKQRAANTLDNEKILAQQRLDLTNALFSAISSVVDENSSFGKALAVAQALINTYQGISAGVALGFPAAIPAVAAAAATGFKAVKDILSTEVPSAEGGTVQDRSSGSAAGGNVATDFQNLAANESNLSQVSGSGNAVVQDQIQANANNAGLTESVATAVRDGAQAGTQAGSEQGLTNLSDNKQIENLSSF